MGRIIIDYDVDPIDAVCRVKQVLEGGRVSTSRVRGVDVPHYCWATTWQDETIVLTRRKGLPYGADSFQVIQATKYSPSPCLDDQIGE